MSHFPYLPPAEGDEDQPCPPIFTQATDTSVTYRLSMNIPHHEEANDGDHHHFKQQQRPMEFSEQLLIFGSSHRPPPSCQTNSSSCGLNSNTIEPSFSNRFVVEKDQLDPPGRGQWMSSKMRIIENMMSTPGRNKLHLLRSRDGQLHGHDSTTNNSIPLSGIIRVCSDCNTTKTPLWRSGPRGPKSLCNACGIRQRKARCALAAAAAGGGSITTNANVSVKKVRRSADVDRTVPLKKRHKIAMTGCDQTLSKNSPFDRPFPKDERDAAILLMALSCGLTHC